MKAFGKEWTTNVWFGVSPNGFSEWKVRGAWEVPYSEQFHISVAGFTGNFGRLYFDFFLTWERL